MLHGTIRKNDFYRKTALQHCFELLQQYIVPTLRPLSCKTAGQSRVRQSVNLPGARPLMTPLNIAPRVATTPLITTLSEVCVDFLPHQSQTLS